MDRGSESTEGRGEQQELLDSTETEERQEVVEEVSTESEPATEERDPVFDDADAIATAKRLLGEKNEQAEKEEKAPEAEEPVEEKEVSPQETSLPEDIDPPARFSAEMKQKFKRWPKTARAEINKTIRDLEAQSTKNWQQASKAYNECKHILDEVRPYYQANPDFAKNNISEAGIIRTLLGNHRALTSEDYNTRRETWLNIGKSIGMDVDKISSETANTGDSGQVDTRAIQNLINNTLQEKLNPLTSYVESQRKAQEESQVAAISQEIRAVMDEKDSLGNFTYPELHDQNYHIQQVKPLVAALVRSMPNLKYGDAYKMAVASLRTKEGKSPQLIPTGLPSNNQSQNTKAVEAGVSARGKTSSVVNVEKLTPLQERVMNMFPVGQS